MSLGQADMDKTFFFGKKIKEEMCECVGQRNVWLRRPEVYIHRCQGNGLCTWFLPKQWQERLAFTSFGISYMLLKIKLRSVTSSTSSGKRTPSYCPSMKETNGLAKTKRVNSGMSQTRKPIRESMTEEAAARGSAILHPHFGSSHKHAARMTPGTLC